MQAFRGVLNGMIFDSCIYHCNVFEDMSPFQTFSNQYVQEQVQVYVCLKLFIQIQIAIKPCPKKRYSIS